MSPAVLVTPLPAPALEQHRTAAIVLGAEPLTSWRPSNVRLRALVDSVAAVQAASGPRVDVGDVLDRLRVSDPSWPWPSFVRQLFTRWDECIAAADQRRGLLELGRLVEDAYTELGVHVDALVTARAEADRALAVANGACNLFEREARALGVRMPPESGVRLAVGDVATWGPMTAANDLRARGHA